MYERQVRIKSRVEYFEELGDGRGVRATLSDGAHAYAPTFGLGLGLTRLTPNPDPDPEPNPNQVRALAALVPAPLPAGAALLESAANTALALSGATLATAR